MKNVYSLLIVGIVVLSGFVGSSATQNNNLSRMTETFSFSVPVTVCSDADSGYLTVMVKETNGNSMNPGQPMMPKVVKVFDLPFAAENVHIECTVLGTQELCISQQIVPAPQPIVLQNDVYQPSALSNSEKDEAVYSSHELYPTAWYSYRLTGGLNAQKQQVTHATVHLYPVRYSPTEHRLVYATSMIVTITYEPSQRTMSFGNQYDLLIIAPRLFSGALQPLIDHKNDHHINTTLITTQEIYRKYDGVDKPEKIKNCIKDAREQYGITYVLLVGGLRSYIFAIDRQNPNEGSRAWWVPVRYTNVYEAPPVYDPGYLSDHYYADLYDGAGEFSSWDSNDDGIFASWGRPGSPKDTIDLDPDVYVGRLACRNINEVKSMVNKIIRYETTSSAEWLKKMIVIAGDGFQDQNDLKIEWDVKGLTTGRYTIYAQSNNSEGTYGPLDVINVTVDRSISSSVTFSENDNLKISVYPAPPIAEITSPSEGNTLGSSNVNYVPSEAYLGEYWARVQYINGVMTIRGKSYDPRPHGSSTQIHVWIKDSQGNEVFNVIKQSLMYFEGELETWQACEYLPEDFEKQILWSSNGAFTNQQDVIDAISEGSGFVYFAGHGNPRVWANHYPGIPGGRANASIYGLMNFNVQGLPFFPMRKLTNTDKLPVLLVGGCHNSQFNVTLIKTLNLTEKFGIFAAADVGGYWTHGVPLTECWSWTLVRQSKTGAIATIGCTGLGYGIRGANATKGVGGWINNEFFRIVAEKLGQGTPLLLGDIYGEALSNYVEEFPVMGQLTDCKTVEEWALLGDPSLMIGGYAS